MESDVAWLAMADVRALLRAVDDTPVARSGQAKRCREGPALDFEVFLWLLDMLGDQA